MAKPTEFQEKVIRHLFKVYGKVVPDWLGNNLDIFVDKKDPNILYASSSRPIKDLHAVLESVLQEVSVDITVRYISMRDCYCISNLSEEIARHAYIILKMRGDI